MRSIVPSLVFFALACDLDDGALNFPEAAADASATSCPMPPLDVLQPGIAPPNPTDLPPAPGCATLGYDAILVLGCPSQDDGDPSSCQRNRVELALRFADAGYADQFIVSGGAVKNAHVEADGLAQLLREAGVVEEAIVREPQARHTDENIYYSTQLMVARDWTSVLVVSEVGHLLYAALCDANCCVRQGRMSVLDFEFGPAGHYILTPPAEPVSNAECIHLSNRTRLQCTQLESRKACADDFRLD